YDVDGKMYLVDLPGYGYAKRSFDERNKWKKLVDKYFSLEGPSLYLQLVDLKVGLTKDDKDMISFLDESGLPFAIVATKSDKVNTTEREKNLKALENDETVPEDAEIIPFSAKTGAGAGEIWRIISEFVEFNTQAN
ncbi:MAG: YihA family ribosome biogenesis GTP-binding protein, partial [Clostridia bacterium]|nr:YihA family ribosome biogenesis GTP-binding protein [Clostridia bacterium]